MKYSVVCEYTDYDSFIPHLVCDIVATGCTYDEAIAIIIAHEEDNGIFSIEEED